MKKAFKIWRTIELGPRPTLNEIGISEYVQQDLLTKVKFDKIGKIDLVKLKVSDLRIKQGRSTLTQIYEKIKELGLELCPPEVGPILREEYSDQHVGKWLYIGMEPIDTLSGSPGIFCLARNDDGLWVYGRWFDNNDGLHPEDEFVFSLPNDSLKLKTSEVTRIPDTLELEKRVKKLEDNWNQWQERLRRALDD